MSDPDYPGALRAVGDGWRLAVSPDGRRYRLQPLVRGAAGPSWASPPAFVASSLGALLEKCGGLVDGLAVACDGLPDDPALAAPDLSAQRRELLAGVADDRAKAARDREAKRAAFFCDRNEKRRASRRARSGS